MSLHFHNGARSYISRPVTPLLPQRSPLTRICVSLPEALLAAVDRLVTRRRLPSRSHAIALMLSQCTAEHEDAGGDEPTIGTVTLRYSSLYEVHRELGRIRDRSSAEIISTLNVKTFNGETLEVMVVRGAAGAVRALGDETGRLRGVVFCKTQLVGYPGPRELEEQSSDEAGPVSLKVAIAS
jgi:metal-responsive CopG/Arc/MetJ family transcriptional regulator